MSGTPEPDRLARAAALRAALAEGMDESRQMLEMWLAEDPRNREAWRRVQAPWNLLAEHATSPALIHWRRAALAHAQRAARDQRTERSTRTLGRIAAVVILAVCGLVVWNSNRPEVYRTGAGERRVVTLADGSRIALDSQSEVSVRFGPHARELTLSRGQARFDVAHDAARPFTVAAIGNTVVATGTAFNVDLLGPELLVTLLEGSVIVLPEKASLPLAPGDSLKPDAEGETGSRRELGSAADSWGEPHTSSRIVLSPGEQLVLAPKAPPSITRVSVERAIAWQSGALVFDNEPLETVVARVSRYGARQIMIDDQRTADLRISGVFHEGDIDGFVNTIVSYLPVRAQPGPDGSVRLSARVPDAPVAGK